jgi:hypothetical protein
MWRPRYCHIGLARGRFDPGTALRLSPSGPVRQRAWLAGQITRPDEESSDMATMIAFMEVDDVDRWLKSPKRLEVFSPIGVTGKLFVDPAQSNRVGVLAEIPDMEAFQAAMQSQTVATSMREDGVRMESFVMLVEAADHM